ncbi:C6 transcription factor [Xylariaceae sp. FL0255]|nr:C6 transcription factor [Xylariaceae sp. FL0255]
MASPVSSPASPSRPRGIVRASRLPDVNRKITACEGCRKQKIRCHMTDYTPPCERCRKKGLTCVNRGLQMDDIAWKEAIEQKIQDVEDKFATLVSRAPSFSASSQNTESALIASDAIQEAVQCDLSGTKPSEGAGVRIVVDLESNPANLPGIRLYHAAWTRPESPLDVVRRGVITLENARKYQSVYQDRLDHFLYGILGDHGNATFEQLQQRSPILGTVVCAVGALHLASPDFDALYEEFVVLSTAMSFSKRNTTDDIQALLIGAFWISDLSSSLVSFAVRIATELQLYRSFFKALQGDRDSYLCARLYYLVYACDHHLSIPHGRPPITRNCEAVQNVRQFLDCKYANEKDARLVSHVLRWRVCTDIYDTMGVNVDRPLTPDELPKVRRFSIELDSLRVEWGDKFRPDIHIGNYPCKGVGIQHHFAKLFLFSHVFRSLSSDHVPDKDYGVDVELYEMASSAVLSAIAILRTVTSDPEIQSFLNGLPTYFHVMIAFAVVFLLKISTRFSILGEIHTHTHDVQRLIAKLVVVLKEVSKTMHPRHLLVTITKGTEDALHKSNPVPPPATGSVPCSPGGEPSHVLQDSQMDTGDMFVDEVVHQFFNEYDFLIDHFQDPGV